tara:strand:+ start:954 stop:1970 length:1017 start_codon:yes stop_codon:yes gene_type:complete
MAYIGKSPQVGNYIKLDAITTSSTNTYNLLNGGVAFVPESALHMLVSLNGVIQAPLTAYSVSGSTITFLPSSGTLSSSDSIDFILVLGNTLDIGTPSDSTVTNAKTNFVSTSSSAGLSIKGDGTTDGTLQLNCSQNSHGVKLASPAHSAGQSYTLKLPTGNLTAGNVLKINSISGSGTTAIGQLEAPSELTMPNQPSWFATANDNTVLASGGYTQPLLKNELWDNGSDYDASASGTHRFTAPVAGKYLVIAGIGIVSNGLTSSRLLISIWKNDYLHQYVGSNYSAGAQPYTTNGSTLVDLSANDYLRMLIQVDGGNKNTDFRTDQQYLATFFGGYLLG